MNKKRKVTKITLTETYLDFLILTLVTFCFDFILGVQYNLI